MMTFVERVAWAAVCLGLAGGMLLGRGKPRAPLAVDRARAEPGVRLTMDALHQQGGTPLGWQPTLAPGNPAAGRVAFESLGCSACHRIAGESFANAVADPVGPDLTGMGSHRPPAYFAEAILNPDAVVIDAPGYVDASGHSIMPSYDAITIGELEDLVAYLTALTDGGAPSCHAGGTAALGSNVTMASPNLQGRPAPSATEAKAFFARPTRSFRGGSRISSSGSRPAGGRDSSTRKASSASTRTSMRRGPGRRSRRSSASATRRRSARSFATRGSPSSGRRSTASSDRTGTSRPIVRSHTARRASPPHKRDLSPFGERGTAAEFERGAGRAWP
jgi:mono/diheme cytochrome c family protein